jgi:hypothetical protein
MEQSVKMTKKKGKQQLPDGGSSNSKLRFHPVHQHAATDKPRNSRIFYVEKI